MANGLAGIGTLLGYETPSSSPVTYTTIANVSSISGPKLKASTYDVTSMSSLNNYREFISGLKDAGEVTFNIWFDPSEGTHDESTGILGFLEDRTARNWQIAFPVSPVVAFTFSGVVTGFDITSPVDGAITASLTIKISGKATLS